MSEQQESLVKKKNPFSNALFLNSALNHPRLLTSSPVTSPLACLVFTSTPQPPISKAEPDFPATCESPASEVLLTFKALAIILNYRHIGLMLIFSLPLPLTHRSISATVGNNVF